MLGLNLLDLIKNDVIFRIFVRNELNKIFPEIFNIDKPSIFYIKVQRFTVQKVILLKILSHLIVNSINSSEDSKLFSYLTATSSDDKNRGIIINLNNLFELENNKVENMLIGVIKYKEGNFKLSEKFKEYKDNSVENLKLIGNSYISLKLGKNG